MKVKFNEWDLGGKLIFISSILAVISLFMPWADLGIFSVSGFQQDGYLFLVLFIYPFYRVMKNQSINKIIGLISSGLAFIISLMFLFSKSVDMFGSTINAGGIGLYLFVITTIGLIVGVIKYSVIEENIIIEEEKI